MNTGDYKKILEYANNEEIYIVSKKMSKYKMTQTRKKIIERIEDSFLDYCLRMTLGIVNKNGKMVVTYIRLIKRASSQGVNSYIVNKDIMSTVCYDIGIELETLISSCDIIRVDLDNVRSKMEARRQKNSNRQTKAKVISTDDSLPITEDLNKWMLQTNRENKRQATKYEKVLFNRLENALGKRVKKQALFIINGKICYADICIKSKKTIIEVDGGYHNTPEQRAKDKERDKAFASIGYRTIRLTNEQAWSTKFTAPIIAELKKKNHKIK